VFADGESHVVGNAMCAIQTWCDSTPYSVKSLEDNAEMKSLTGVTTFKPSLDMNICPSPYIYLVKGEDVISNSGMPCTKDYKQVQHSWKLATYKACPAPTNYLFMQMITLGGLIDQNGEPATPRFDLQPVTYFLPNIPKATIATNVSDLYHRGISPGLDCGICNNSLADAVFYNHLQNFICDKVGENTVSVTVTSNISISVIKKTIMIMTDIYPPNITCPDFKIVPCGNVCPERAGFPVAVDNCKAALTYTDSRDTFFNGTYSSVATRTWIVTDPSGNSVSCEQSIIHNNDVTNGSVTGLGEIILPAGSLTSN